MRIPTGPVQQHSNAERQMSCSRVRFVLSVSNPTFVWGITPVDINVFCDGGFSHPTMSCFGLGSYGVWLPRLQYQPDGSNLTPLQTIYSARKEVGDGVGLYGAIPGHSGSSGRSEIAGVTVATFTNYPCKVGIDNLSVQRNATRIIQRALNTSQPHSSFYWSQQPNGDMWKVFEQCIYARGAHSICFEKK